MQTKNYTSENICFALGMDGFANDWHLAKADESMRLLLMPSFHPEVCVSFLKVEGAVTVRVETPRTQVWRQDYPTPHKTLTDVATGTASAAEYARLLELFERANNPPPGPRFAVIDGMPAHCIHRKAGERVFDIQKNASAEGAFKAFLSEAISIAWNSISDPRVRNALRSTGTYANLQLQAQELPPDKPLVRTMIIGAGSDASAILEALEKHHAPPKAGGED